MAIHCSEEGASLRQRVPECLTVPHPDTAVIACGPEGFIQRLRSVMEEYRWSPSQFVFERFTPAAENNTAAKNAFYIELASSGQRLQVAADQTIAQVLQHAGVEVMLSCEQGMCGSCITGVLDGIPEHRDSVLTAEESWQRPDHALLFAGEIAGSGFGSVRRLTMTLPSSCAPLTGISRARLPAWALPDGWPTQANGEPLLADLAFRDSRIAALTPTDQPTPGLWDLAGALTLPAWWNPMPIWTRHSLLNAAVQRRPGCCRRSTPCMRIADTGPGRIFNAERPPRWPGRQRMA